ncbi:extracellular solute-binding protein [Pendulispora brunnea]|uniref:Extracellular solute-binding protein n=1 Tax=Pendulispora brunnea TaxID=2905690 RepID=A0ABZ2JVK6_9BACT
MLYDLVKAVSRRRQLTILALVAVFFAALAGLKLVPGLPMWLDATLQIVLAAALAHVVISVVRRCYPVENRLPADDAIVSSSFATVGGVYGLIAGFLIVMVWQSYSDTGVVVAREANAIADLERMSRGFPVTVQLQIQQASRRYVRSVVKEEWPLMAKGEQSQSADDALAALWSAYTEIEGRQRGSSLYDQSVRRLNEVDDNRRLRLLASRDGVPVPLWIILWGGGIGTLIIGCLFEAGNFVVHRALITFLAAILSFSLYLISALEHPFDNRLPTSAEPLERVLAGMLELEAPKSLGKAEGKLDLVTWAGYAEDGSHDPNVDWVHPFEGKTGCKVNAKIANSSDEMVRLMKTGEYDVVSASGDASLRLIASGTVAPVNTDLIPSYADLFPALKLKPWNSVNRVPYGVPHGRGANLLVWRTDKVPTAPESWAAVLEPAAGTPPQLSVYDSPIYLADAAVYLMMARPQLGIRNPYALDDQQFLAVLDVLRNQRHYVGQYWSDYTEQIQSFKTGTSVIGTTWQITANLAKAEGAPIATTLPKEGATGWSDTWMIAAKARHPTCAYEWMNWIASPKINAQVAEFYGQAPANAKACNETADPKFCEVFHAADEAYYAKVHYWTTPTSQCLDGRTSVQCKDYAEWSRAWAEIAK